MAGAGRATKRARTAAGPRAEAEAEAKPPGELRGAAEALRGAWAAAGPSGRAGAGAGAEEAKAVAAALAAAAAAHRRHGAPARPSGAALHGLTEALAAAAAGLQGAVDGARAGGGAGLPAWPTGLSLGAEGGPATPASRRAAARALERVAHRLGFTSGAPPQFEPGDPRWSALGPQAPPLGSGLGTGQRFCTPPAPQAWHMAASILYRFAAEAAPAEAEEVEAPAAASPEPAPAAPAAGAWKEGDALPEGLPQMPADWKPGDALPGFERKAAPAPAPAAPGVKYSKAVNFILNPDLEQIDEEELSSSIEDDDSSD